MIPKCVFCVPCTLRRLELVESMWPKKGLSDTMSPEATHIEVGVKSETVQRKQAVQRILRELKSLDWHPATEDVATSPHHAINDIEKSRRIYEQTGVFFKQGNKNLLCVREHPVFKGTGGCRNQDGFSVSRIKVDDENEFYVFCVCDGHGLSTTDEGDKPGEKSPGHHHRAGDVCSRRGVRCLMELIELSLRAPNVRTLIQKGQQSVVEAYFSYVFGCIDDLMGDLPGGTTCTVVIMDIAKAFAYSAFVGDSSGGFVFRSRKGDAKARALGEYDHNFANPKEIERLSRLFGRDEMVELRRKGQLITQTKSNATKALNVTRALGDREFEHVGKTAKPDCKVWLVTEPVEFLIIGSDGVWDMIQLSTVADHLSRVQSTDGLYHLASRVGSDAMIRYQKATGGACDDTTLLLVDVRPLVQLMVSRLP